LAETQASDEADWISADGRRDKTILAMARLA